MIAAGRNAPTPARSRSRRLGILVAWLVHTSVDWIHLLPGVTAIAIVAAVCLVRRPEQPRSEARRPALRWGATLGVALARHARGGQPERQALSGHFVSAARSALATGSGHARCERPIARCGSIPR